MGKELAEFIKSFFENPTSGVVLAAIASLLWFNTRSALRYPDDDKGRQDRSIRLNILRQNRFAALYQKLVGNVLSFIDRLIYPPNFRQNKPTRQESAYRNQEKMFNGLIVWDEKTYSFCLSLAFIYPVFAILIPWALGSNGRILGFPLLPEEPNTYSRILIVSIVIAAVVAGMMFSKSNKENVRVRLAGWVLLSCTAVVVSILLKFPLVLIIGIAANSVLASVGSGLTSTLAVLFMGIAVSVAFFLFQNYHHSVLVLVGVIFFCGLNSFWNWYRNRERAGKKPSVLLILLWNALWFLTVCVCLLITKRYITEDEVLFLDIQSLLSLFVLLPLINAPFDWLSLGLTRGLLHKIKTGHHNIEAIAWGVVDLLLAALFWLVTLLSTLVLFQVLNYASDAMSFGASGFLTELAINPWSVDVLWLQILAATTILPTFLHLLVACFSLTHIVTGFVGTKLFGSYVEGWPDGEEVTGDRLNVATTFFTASIMISFILPIYIILSLGIFEGTASKFISEAAGIINNAIFD